MGRRGWGEVGTKLPYRGAKCSAVVLYSKLGELHDSGGRAFQTATKETFEKIYVCE